jgi:hypothetical protein
MAERDLWYGEANQCRHVATRLSNQAMRLSKVADRLEDDRAEVLATAARYAEGMAQAESLLALQVEIWAAGEHSNG